MIGRLRGEVVEHDEESLVVDVNGVGYVLRVTATVIHQVHELLGTRQSVDQRSDKKIDLVVHTEVRENDISLYGFSSSLEKRVFLLLQKVKGVGARVSLQIVSNIGAESLLSTIGQGSVASLCTVPGVGKKTAERIIVELREMVSGLLTEVSFDARASLQNRVEVSNVAEDALLALEKLGFPFDAAKQAVLAATQQLGKQASTEDILHVALTKAK